MKMIGKVTNGTVRPSARLRQQACQVRSRNVEFILLFAMIPREIVKKIQQLELRTNRVVQIETILCFALVLAACAGCTTVHNFHGSAANLKGDGERIPPGTHLKMSVTGSGRTSTGDHYVAFHLRGERCWLVLFHRPVVAEGLSRADTASGDAGAWLVRGRKPDCAALACEGRDAPFLADRAERLRGSIEVLWRADDDFYVPVELVGESSETAVQGQFAAYRALWKPLVGPAMLLGVDGARTPKK